MFNNFNINPFLSQTAKAPMMPFQPVTQVAPRQEQAGVFGTGNPFNKASFGHLAGVTKNGPGSFLQTEPGQLGLGDKAIQLGDNKTLGKNLFISI